MGAKSRRSTNGMPQNAECCRPRVWLRAARRLATVVGLCVSAVYIAAAGSLGATVEAADSLPFFQNASIGARVAWNSATSELHLSLDTASITAIGALDGWLPNSSITVGRQAPKWGPGLSGSLLLSGSASLDGIALSAGIGSFRYVQLAAARDVARGRWLLAHRIEGQVAPGVEVGISEAVAVSGGFRLQPYYLVPGCPYFLAQHLNMQDTRSQDWWSNVLAAVDASVAVTPGIRLYGEFMVDDFPWASSARGRVPYMVGGLAGIQVDVPSGLGLEPYRAAIEYVRINNYVYSHKNPENTYVVADGRLIGHPLGPDADAIYLFVSRPVRLDAAGPCRNIEVTSRLGYERHGEGTLGHGWNPSEGVAHEFLSGTVETRTSLGIRVRAYVGPTLRVLPGSPCGMLELATIIESIDNAGHVASARALEARVRLSLQLTWSQ